MTRGEVTLLSWRCVWGEFQIIRGARNSQAVEGIWRAGLWAPLAEDSVAGTEVGYPGWAPRGLTSPPRAPLLDSRLLPQHQPLSWSPRGRA